MSIQNQLFVRHGSHAKKKVWLKHVKTMTCLSSLSLPSKNYKKGSIRPLSVWFFNQKSGFSAPPKHLQAPISSRKRSRQRRPLWNVRWRSRRWTRHGAGRPGAGSSPRRPDKNGGFIGVLMRFSKQKWVFVWLEFFHGILISFNMGLLRGFHSGFHEIPGFSGMFLLSKGDL